MMLGIASCRALARRAGLVTRALSSVARGAELQPLRANRLVVETTDQPKPHPPSDALRFGKYFTDHMLEVDWNSNSGWGAPRIVPYHDLVLSPAALSLHYALQCFEGMKAYRCANGVSRMFRPDKNMERLNRSMTRLYMPEFDADEFLECIKELVRVDAAWVPEGAGQSLYLRPTAIATDPFLGLAAAHDIKLFVIMSPVGAYYENGFQPIKLYADHENARAWPGGAGHAKLGANYGPTILPQVSAQGHSNADQVLWLHDHDGEHYATEVGAMNVFFVLRQPGGGVELCTAPLDRGDILPGVTRLSVLEMAREEMPDLTVNERDVSMSELVQARNEGRLLEVFGAGTAAVIAPVEGIVYRGVEITCASGSKIGSVAERIYDGLSAIQYGRKEHRWSIEI